MAGAGGGTGPRPVSLLVDRAGGSEAVSVISEEERVYILLGLLSGLVDYVRDYDNQCLNFPQHRKRRVWAVRTWLE